MPKAAELRDLDDDELNIRLTEAKQELFNLRFQHVTGQLDNYARLGEVRRSVAQINTVLREREIEAAEAGLGGPNAAAGEAASVVSRGPAAEPQEEEESRRRRRARVLASRRKAGADPEMTDEEGEDRG